MGKDSKQAKHKYSTRSKKKQRAEEEKRKKKYDESSDDSSDSDWESDGEMDLNEEFDMKQYREFLANMFPPNTHRKSGRYTFVKRKRRVRSRQVLNLIAKMLQTQLKKRDALVSFQLKSQRMNPNMSQKTATKILS